MKGRKRGEEAKGERGGNPECWVGDKRKGGRKEVSFHGRERRGKGGTGEGKGREREQRQNKKKKNWENVEDKINRDGEV